MPTITQISAIEQIPRPRGRVREKWLALSAFVVVTAFAAALLQAGPPAAEQQPLIVSIRGDNLYGMYCASCHGEDAKGHGPMAKWLKVPPPDLTRIAARNGGTFPLERVDRIISGDEACPAVTELGPCRFGDRCFHKWRGIRISGRCESTIWRAICAIFKPNSP